MRDPVAGLAEALADRYRLERELGQGGMATVYLARDLKHDRKVAVKVMRPELSTAIGAERFLAEIRVTANLQHPHILPLFDSGQAGIFLYYVMPYVEGESLRDRLTREPQLPFDDVLRITREVAGALDYAHQHGVIHRDIKPENILLTQGGALLADFGIALAVQAAGGERLTETGLSIGTPAYMSPEQATGERNLDARSDVFSLGVVVYEMLAGEAPYTGPSAKAVIAKVALAQPTALTVVRPGVMAHVDAAVQHALQKSPADRFATPHEFVAALERPAAVSRVGERRLLRWGAAAVTAALVLTVGRRWFRSGDRPTSETRPEATQLTFTGNADVPALSPDGKRVAYVSRDCAADGGCSSSILISDIGGSAVLPAVRGRGWIDDIEWTADGRFLLFEDVGGMTRETFVVSTLGGPPLSLGCCSASMLGESDTVLVGEHFPVSGDSTYWLRLATIVDGVVRDSIQLPRLPSFQSLAILGSPDGQRIAVTVAPDTLWTVLILDRSGRLLDSLSQEWETYYVVRWTPSGDALLATNKRGDGRGFDLLRFRVGEGGHLGRVADTLLRELPLSIGHVRVGRAGGLVYAALTNDEAVYALSRKPGPGLRFGTRRLATATGFLLGAVNPSGDRIVLEQATGTGGALVASVMPFDSGPTVPLGPPMQGPMSVAWSSDGQKVLVGASRGDRFVVKETDLGSGLSREVASVPGPPPSLRGFRGYVRVIPGGGLLISVPSDTGCALNRVGVPALSDTVIQAATGVTDCSLSLAPDGRSAVMISFSADSLGLVRVSLVDGLTTGLARPLGQIMGLKWLANGAIEFVVLETEETVGWYRIATPGTEPKRLGSLSSRGMSWYNMSDDGRHVAANVEEPRRDVYLISNFGDLLRQRH
jgi:tRNA A-37 threonylcarbamoyl transferase component Bud32